MIENEKIKRRPGQHCKRNEVKTEIITHILKANGAVPGSEIRRNLNKKYGIGNNKNIKNHLEKLRKDHCIEKFELVGDDFGNEWDITKLENLKKIGELFHNIPQNEYSKCLSLVPFEKIKIRLGCLNTEILRTNAKMSRSFYDMCLKGEFQTAYIRTNSYFMFTKEGHESEQYLRKCIDNFYKKRIEKTNVSPETKIPKDAFKKMLENWLWSSVAEEPELEINKQSNDNFYISQIPQKMLESSTSKMLGKDSMIKKYISEEVPKETFDIAYKTIFKELLENQSEELYNDIREIKTHQKINCTLSYYLFFKSCVLQDFQNCVESPSEKYFLRNLEKSLATLSTIRKKDPPCLYKEWLYFITEQDRIYSSFYEFY